MARRLIEVRSYALQPGAVAALHELFESEVLPLLNEYGMDVVAYGPSGHAADAYCLVRAFHDLADRQAQQDGFYGSADWREGPRESVLALIQAYLDTVLWLDDDAIEALRDANAPEES
jgi:hypothetical protein